MCVGKGVLLIFTLYNNLMMINLSKPVVIEKSYLIVLKTNI